MGNRAVITTQREWDNNGIGIYVHWNGGVESVKAFLDYCDKAGYRSPDHDCYGWARLCQTIANFMGEDGLSVGIDTLDHLDTTNGDNGVYIIEGWNIVKQIVDFNGEWIEISNSICIKDYEDMLAEVIKSQPYGLPKLETDSNNKRVRFVKGVEELLVNNCSNLEGLSINYGSVQRTYTRPNPETGEVHLESTKFTPSNRDLNRDDDPREMLQFKWGKQSDEFCHYQCIEADSFYGIFLDCCKALKEMGV